MIAPDKQAQKYKNLALYESNSNKDFTVLFMPNINLDYMQIIKNHSLSLLLQRFVTELTAYLT